MASLANCIKKANKSLSSQDGQALLDLESSLGDPVAAVNARIAELEAELKAVSTVRKAASGDTNTVFTKEKADSALDLIKSKLGQQNVGIDPELMSAVFQRVGFHVERGLRTFAEVVSVMVDEAGESIVPYLKGAYNNIRDYPEFGPASEMDDASAVSNYVEELANVPSRSGSVEPDSGARETGAPLDNETVQPESKGAGSRAGSVGGNAVESRPRRSSSNSVPKADATASRKPSNQPLFEKDGQPNVESRAAGSNERQRSARDSVERQPARTESDSGVARAAYQQPLEKQRKADGLQQVIGDQANINASLPNLQPAQAEDVYKAEQRYFVGEKTGKGFMLTNGTGTGKTFSGMGVVKRYVQRGKREVLVVVPSKKIATDWVNTAANFFDVPIDQLPTSSQSGSGPTITTYANFQQNEHLFDRDWDLVVYDESHYLKGGQSRDNSGRTNQHLALTRHPNSALATARGIMHEKYTKANSWLKAELDRIEKARLAKEFDPRDGEQNSFIATGLVGEAKSAHQKKVSALIPELDETKVRIAQAPRPEVLFLSATPFAADQAIDYAEGYLFDFQDRDGAGYNSGNGRDHFFMSNFGYRMRYNKLTQPESEVDNALLQREFNETLRKSGSLSRRMLDIDKDYSRQFVQIRANKLGEKIDEGMNYLRGWRYDAEGKMERIEEDSGDYFPKLSAAIEKGKIWDYISMNALLESMNTADAIARANKHVAMGRQVLMFHRYKTRGAFHPFILSKELMEGGMAAGYSASEIQEEYAKFAARRPDLAEMDLGALQNPTVAIPEAFGDAAAMYNGDVSAKEREVLAQRFNDDGDPLKVLLVQIQAGKEGISFHDTTGKHQRALISLGLPIQSTDAIQVEGRTYRTGNESHAIFEYMKQGLMFEERAYAQAVAMRAGAVENLAMGNDARDMMNAFVNGYFEANSDAPSDKQGVGGKAADRQRQEDSPYKRAITHYYKKGKGNKKHLGKDYFATPEPLGLKMVEWADISAKERVLEPSAGHGAIAMWMPTSSQNTTIEPSPDLQGELMLMAPHAKTRGIRFEDLPKQNKYHAIVMNPPFGHAGSDAIAHIKKAADHLYDGGRIVAVYPEGAAIKKLEKWLYEDESNDNIFLTGQIDLPDSTFERAGTKVRARVVILDKVVAPPKTKGERRDVPQQRNVDLSDVDNIKSLFERIENLDMRERSRPETAEGLEIDATTETKPEVKAGSVAGSFSAHDQKHSKTGEQQWIAVPEARVSRDAYQAQAAVAKRMGGYWSRYKNASLGIKAGFALPTEEARNEFIEAMAGVETNFKLVKAKRVGDGKGVSVSAAQAAVDHIVGNWKSKPNIRVVRTTAELPVSVPIPAGVKISGVVQGENVWIVAEGNADPRDVSMTILHEVVGHWAAEQMPGFERMVAHIRAEHTADPVVGAAWKKVENLYPDVTEQVKAYEVVAHMAERAPSHPLLDELVAAFRNLIRKFVPDIRYTAAEIRAFIASAASAAASGQLSFDTQGTEPAYRLQEAPGDSDGFDVPEEQFRHSFIRRVQDKFEPLKTIQRAIDEQRGTINEASDAYLAEELMHDKVALDIELFERRHVEPMVQFLADNGIDPNDLDKFLYARHAPERNATLAERSDGEVQSGSGMTNEEALSIIQGYHESGQLSGLSRAAQYIDEINRARNELIVERGLMTPEEVEADTQGWKYYVPLKGFEDAADEVMPRIGKGLNIRGKEWTSALGRRSKAASPLLNTISQAEETIIRARKAEVGQIFVNLVLENPEPSLWKLYQPGDLPTKKVPVKQADGTIKIKRARYIPVDDPSNNSQRFFNTKIDGKQYYVHLKNPRLANSMASLGPVKLNLFLQTLGTVMRIMSALRTSWNPGFIPVNYARDIQQAIAHVVIDKNTKGHPLYGTEISARKVTIDSIRAMKGAWQGFDNMDAPGEWAKYYNEFREDGGKVGHFGLIDVKSQARKMNSMMRAAKGMRTQKAWDSLSRFVDRLNTAVENSMRLSLYVHARRVGVSRAKSASLAKNLTVNFNRHGELGPGINAGYMFFNAAVQGNASMLTRLAKSKAAWGVAMGIAVTSGTISHLMALLSEDDEDGSTKWDDIPDHIKATNFVVLDFFGLTENGYHAFPMSYGYNAFASLGWVLDDFARGEKTAGEAALVLAGVFASAFNPLGLEGSDDAVTAAGKTITPTLLKPVVYHMTNENFFGGPLMPNRYPNDVRPDSQLAFWSTPQGYKSLAEWMNATTGGTKNVSGFTDVSPESLQLMVETLGGGLGQTATRTLSAISEAASGKSVENRDIPVWRRFVKDHNNYKDQSAFYDRQDGLKQIANEYKALKGDAKSQFRREHRAELRLHDDAKLAMKKIRRINKIRKSIRSNESLSEAEKADRLDQEQVRYDREVDSFNKKYRLAKAS